MGVIRNLKKREIELLKHLLSLLPDNDYNIPNRTKTMDDGEMGSITFDINNKYKFGKRLLEVKYIDSDDIVVFINLIIDQNNNLYELDFWKTDYNKLIIYPTPEKIIQI